METNKKKDITVVCVAYKRYKEIHVLINSFLCQTLENWKLLVIHDGHDERMGKEVSQYTTKYSNINYIETEKRYNDYGHSLRELGISKADTPYILITNDDNYYAPKFIEFMFKEIDRNNLDMVLCNFVSGQNFKFKRLPPHGTHTNIAKVSDGTYVQLAHNVINSIPVKGCVDIGNVIVKTKLSVKVGFRDKTFYGDGTYIEDILALNPGKIRVGKVDRVLFVHN